MACLQQYGMKRFLGKKKWATVNDLKNSSAVKIILCIWRDWNGIVYIELFPQNHTLNSNHYCSQWYQWSTDILLRTHLHGVIEIILTILVLKKGQLSGTELSKTYQPTLTKRVSWVEWAKNQVNRPWVLDEWLFSDESWQDNEDSGP